jgi:hypothetical protein
MYHHFLSGIPDVPESIVRNLWERKNLTSNLFERKTNNTRYSLQERATFQNRLFDFNHGNRRK